MSFSPRGEPLIPQVYPYKVSGLEGKGLAVLIGPTFIHLVCLLNLGPNLLVKLLHLFGSVLGLIAHSRLKWKWYEL